MGVTATRPDPSLLVGPQDPDATAELTQRYGVGNNAVKLLEAQADNYPAELRALLSLPIDDDRSQALLDEDVYAAAGDLLRETKRIGDEDRAPELVESYVRGSDDRSRVVTITYISPSGRSAKAALGAWAGDGFSKSRDAYEELRRGKMGLAAAQARVAGDSQVPADSPEAEALREEVERLSTQLREAQDPEPVDEYTKANAENIAKMVGAADRATAARVLDYEKRHENRKTVIEAAQKRVDALDAEEAEAATAADAEKAALNERVAQLEAQLAKASDEPGDGS